MKKNIAVAGLGLIGGSLARAFRTYTDCTVAGFDRDPEVVRAALRCGAISRAGSEKDIRKSDILHLCLYPRAAVQFTEKNLGAIPAECVVTDTCGVKESLCREMGKLARRGGFSFLGSHPMAGNEKSGFSAGRADLFKGADYIITPCGAPERAVGILKTAALSIGFSRVILSTPEEHDQRIAFTSQLPHAVACAYVNCPAFSQRDGFSGGSCRDLSRVADINEILWTELFLENRGPLLHAMDALTESLAEIRKAVASGDSDALRAILARSRMRK